MCNLKLLVEVYVDRVSYGCIGMDGYFFFSKLEMNELIKCETARFHFK